MARKTARALAAPSGARPPRQKPPRSSTPEPEAPLTPGAWRTLAADLDQAAEQRAEHDRFYRYLKGLADHYREQGRRVAAGMDLLPRPSLSQLLREMSGAAELRSAVDVEQRKRELREQLTLLDPPPKPTDSHA